MAVGDWILDVHKVEGPGSLGAVEINPRVSSVTGWYPCRYWATEYTSRRNILRTGTMLIYTNGTHTLVRETVEEIELDLADCFSRTDKEVTSANR